MNDSPRQSPLQLPRVAVTMGDPAGVGPEIALKAVSRDDVRSLCTPIIFGDPAVLARVADRLGLRVPPRVIAPDEWPTACHELSEPAVRELTRLGDEVVRPGTVSAETGRASYQYVEAAIDAALAGEVEAIATGPIHKEALHAAGVPFPGHTEILAARTGTDRYCMMLTSEEVTCSLVTVHVGYAKVPGLLSVGKIGEVIELTAAAMRRLRGREPRLAVCGLNPHAGEGGLFGEREEERLIVPAIEAARRAGLTVAGPLPPDTAFLPARRRQTDAYVCMYHDQGLIPLKTLAFDRGVNVTLGLPIVRASVDHGTALDIAWQGLADESSLVEAIRLAARLASGETVV